MVNMLMALQLPADCLLHDPAVLSYAAPIWRCDAFVFSLNASCKLPSYANGAELTEVGAQRKPCLSGTRHRTIGCRSGAVPVSAEWGATGSTCEHDLLPTSRAWFAGMNERTRAGSAAEFPSMISRVEDLAAFQAGDVGELDHTGMVQPTIEVSKESWP